MITPQIILEISTVIGCKIRCGYCPQKVHIRNYAERSSNYRMDLELFKLCLLTVPKEIEIQFAGMAEPFLNSGCIDMIEYAHQCSHAVCVFTTCVGMSQQHVDRLKKIPLRIFCIHLPDDSGQMKMTVDKEYVDVVKSCIEKIPTYSLMCVGNVHPLVRDGIGVDVVDWSKALISRAGNVASVPVKYKSGPLKRLPCLEHNVLLPNGDVVLCCMDYAQKSILGNLLIDHYDDLFSGAEFQRILRGLTDETESIICRDCEIAEKI